MVITVPDTHGRYYMMPMLDMWTEVFACPGARTTGTGAGRFALVPQGWTGSLPSDVQRIDAPTPYVWIIGRTQTNGVQDYDAVHKVQAGYTVVPLSYLGKEPPPVKAVIDPAWPGCAGSGSTPADAFCSVTLYDEGGFPTANSLNRNAIGDRDGLAFNADGSLDLFIQNESPGEGKESNWLPAPTGDFNLTMRLYVPKREALDGRWAPPAVKQAK